MGTVSLTDRVTIGVDIGQKIDPTAIVVCQATRRATGRMIRGASYGDGSFDQRRAFETVFEARSMVRMPLGTSYPAVAARIAEVAAGVRAYNPGGVYLTLVVDATGVGQPVVDILEGALRGRGVRLCAATFTHGDRLDGQIYNREVRVGKAYLVSRLQALLQTDRLRLPPQHPEAAAMARELADYEIRIDQDANDRYGAFRVGQHDDYVTALGLAVLADPPGRQVWSM